ncbi:hypothetical protein NC651_039485 [Populus alba x Populus x berolinensis]|nr:hypothetical protein NC651_039485 [Populus alba x Populus x berolinensis]
MVRHEAKFLKKIVGEISRELNSTYLFVAFYPVGINPRVQQLNFLLNAGSSEVCIVGIYGMGGIGKTTIAKAMYNELFRCFDGKCFLAIVREISQKPNGLVKLQEQLLFDILKTDKIKIGNVDRGMNMIKERLHSRRVLLILDDVDKLEAIAGSRDWFGSGSRIIVTTRDKNEGASILFKLPKFDGRNLKGMNVCIVCSSHLEKKQTKRITIKLTNHTKGFTKDCRKVAVNLVKSCEDHLWQGHISNKSFELDSEDDVELIVDCGNAMTVKKNGVYLVAAAPGVFFFH